MKTVFKNIAIVMWYVMCLFFLLLGSRLASVEEYYVDGAIMSTITISLVAASFIYKFAIKSKVNKQKEASSNISTQYDKEKASNGNIECGENLNENKSQKPDVFKLRHRNTIILVVSILVCVVCYFLSRPLSSVIEAYEDSTLIPSHIKFFNVCISFITLISFIVIILALIRESRYSKLIANQIHIPNRTITNVEYVYMRRGKNNLSERGIKFFHIYSVTYDDGSSKIVECPDDSDEYKELLHYPRGIKGYTKPSSNEYDDKSNN